MEYKKGYKYQLAEDFQIELDSFTTYEASTTDFIQLWGKTGDYYRSILLIKKGYAWDGASGPAIDTKTFMISSLVHDALYQLIREGLLNIEFRSVADQILYDMCIKNGMCKLRAWWVYKTVKYFAKEAASPRNKKEVFIV